MLFILLISAAVLLLIFIQQVLMNNMNHWKKKGVKYVKPLPLFGNMLPTVTQSIAVPELVQYFYNKFPEERYVGIYQFLTPTLLIRDPELIKIITVKHFESFTDHTGFLSADADPLWGKNLFSSKGERWRDLRQTLSPVFTSSKMRTMFILMEECARRLVNYFKKSGQDLIELELKDIFSRYTNDVIASTAFGINCDSLKFKENDFLTAGKEVINVTGLRKLKFLLCGNYPKITKFLGIKIVSKRVGEFFKSIIDETIKLRETNNIVRPDLIHLLMQTRNGKLKYEDSLNLPVEGFAATTESTLVKHGSNTVFLTNEDMAAQALLFFLGGFDTSSSLMAYVGYELAINSEVHRKLREEIITNSTNNGERVTYESLLNMKYLDMVISETLRKWPQGIWLERVCTKPFEIKPEKAEEPTLKIDAGDILMIPVYAIQRDPKYYPNPDLFDPERFSEANKDQIPSFIYLPFGVGPRNCIGSRFALLETKILLYYILLYYDFVPTEKTQVPLKIDKNHIFLQAENGFHVGLRRRRDIN